MLHGIGDGGKVGDLSGELLKQSGEDDQARAEGDLTLDIQPAAVGEENHEAELREKLRDRREDGEIVKNALLLGGNGVVGVFETAETRRLGGKAFDRLHSKHALRKGLNERVGEFTIAQIAGAQPL